MGGLAYVGLDSLVSRVASGIRNRMRMIYLAVATALFGDGLLIGDVGVGRSWDRACCKADLGRCT